MAVVGIVVVVAAVAVAAVVVVIVVVAAVVGIVVVVIVVVVAVVGIVLTQFPLPHISHEKHFQYQPSARMTCWYKTREIIPELGA